MMRFYLLILVFTHFTSYCLCQCPEVFFETKIESANYYYSDLVEKEGRVYVYGGFIYEGINISLRDNNQNEYTSHVNNSWALMDGVSFDKILFIDKEKEQKISVKINECEFDINVPDKVTRISISKSRSRIIVDIYKLKT